MNHYITKKLVLKAGIALLIAVMFVIPTSIASFEKQAIQTPLTMTMEEIQEPMKIGGPIKLEQSKIPFTKIEKPLAQLIGTDVQITSATEFEEGPALAITNKNEMLACYELETDITESNIYMSTSNDEGQSWTDQGLWNVEGSVEEFTCVDYAGEVGGAQMFHGMFISSTGNYGDGYHFDMPDLSDPLGWILWITQWSGNGFFDFSGCDIVAYDQIIGASTDYFTMGIIGSFEGISGYPDCYQVPLYQISVDDSSWIYWFYYNYSANPTMDIDRSAEIIYYGFEADNGTNSDVILLSSELEFVGQVEPGGWGDGMGEGRKRMVAGSANATNPAVAAEEDIVYLIVETDVNGNKDIICYYSTDSGDTYSMSVIADSSSDETYPAITINGDTAICTFTKEGNLYRAVSTDNGATWTVDTTAFNDNDGTVVEGYRNADVFRFGAVWTDDRNGNGDIYYDVVGEIPELPEILITEVAGGLSSVNAILENAATVEASDIHWSIKVTGGLLGRIDVLTEGDTTIAGGATEAIATDQNIFGLGQLTIVIQSTYAEAWSGTALVLGPFILRVQEA